MEVPEDYKKLVLDMGSTAWCSTSQALLFHKTLGISPLARKFAKYRDALIFGMSLAECTWAELEPTS